MLVPFHLSFVPTNVCPHPHLTVNLSLLYFIWLYPCGGLSGPAAPHHLPNSLLSPAFHPPLSLSLYFFSLWSNFGFRESASPSSKHPFISYVIILLYQIRILILRTPTLPLSLAPSPATAHSSSCFWDASTRVFPSSTHVIAMSSSFSCPRLPLA